MIAWKERPFEVASLLNPAFCALLIHAAITDFAHEGGQDDGMSYSLSFLLLPLVLHKKLRETLPKTTSNEMGAWLRDHPEISVQFPSIAKRLVPFTKEAIIFGMQKKAVAVARSGKLVPGIVELSLPRSWPRNSEPAFCYERSRFVGRWFAQTGSDATIFRLWGVRL